MGSNKSKGKPLSHMESSINATMDTIHKMQAGLEKSMQNLPNLMSKYSKPIKGGAKANVTNMSAVIIEFKTQAEAEAFYNKLE